MPTGHQVAQRQRFPAANPEEGHRDVTQTVSLKEPPAAAPLRSSASAEQDPPRLHRINESKTSRGKETAAGTRTSLLRKLWFSDTFFSETDPSRICQNTREEETKMLTLWCEAGLTLRRSGRL